MTVADLLDFRAPFECPVSAASVAELLVLLHALAATALGTDAVSVSSVAFALGFAFAHGRPRHFLVPLWIILRGASGPLALRAVLLLLAVAVFFFPAACEVLPSSRSRVAALIALVIGSSAAARALCFSLTVAPTSSPSWTPFSSFLLQLTPTRLSPDGCWAAPPRLTRATAAFVAAGSALTAAVAAAAFGDVQNFIARAWRECAFLPITAAFFTAVDALLTVHTPRVARALRFLCHCSACPPRPFSRMVCHAHCWLRFQLEASGVRCARSMRAAARELDNCAVALCDTATVATAMRASIRLHPDCRATNAQSAVRAVNAIAVSISIHVSTIDRK